MYCMHCPVRGPLGESRPPIWSTPDNGAISNAYSLGVDGVEAMSHEKISFAQGRVRWKIAGVPAAFPKQFNYAGPEHPVAEPRVKPFQLQQCLARSDLMLALVPRPANKPLMSAVRIILRRVLAVGIPNFALLLRIVSNSTRIMHHKPAPRHSLAVSALDPVLYSFVTCFADDSCVYL
jgi:hypothetical protein